MADGVSASAAPASVWRSSWIGHEIRSNALVYWLLGSFVSGTFAFATLRGDDVAALVGLYAWRASVAAVLLADVALIAIGLRCLAGREGSPIAAFVQRLALIWRDGFVGRFLFASLLLAFFLAAFLYCKMLIPELQPFSWDATFAEWDAMLFGGRHPWEILQPVLGFPAVTIGLDFLYNAWLALIFIFWAGLFASGRVPPEVRQQFWLATVLAWPLIGLVLAVVFSSAGPCFFAQVLPGTPSPYLGLEDYLARVSNEHMALSSTATKEFLWLVHTGQLSAPGGISAMPSVHNAQAVLFAAVAYRLNPRFGHAMAVYAALIYLGSIHLGWHYASDGVVGGAAALAIWKLAGMACTYLPRGRRPHEATRPA